MGPIVTGSQTFAARLRAWRRRCALSQSDAELALQLRPKTIGSWESGRRRPIREHHLLMAMELVERRILAERARAGADG